MFIFLGVYRRFRFNEELVKSPPAESLADVTQGDTRVDVTPPLESQGRFFESTSNYRDLFHLLVFSFKINGSNNLQSNTGR